jgi:membrane fusion protein, heavy metal efflux system
MNIQNESRSKRTGILLTLALATSVIAGSCSSNSHKDAKEKESEKSGSAHEVVLSEETLKAVRLETGEATLSSPDETLSVPGTVEVNQQLTQQATPLVSGRIEKVFVTLGGQVAKGAVLAMIASPQIAEMHGKLHEAETALAIAERNYERVQKSENRVAVLKAKAQLDETEAALRRTRRLIELGAGAGKDLIAAETAYKTARAEHDFQSNIALNKEFAEARAAVDTARVDVKHMRDQLAALGAPIAADEKDLDHAHDTSLIALRSPVTGTVTERLVNAGAGVQAGMPLFTISDISSLWVIAQVPVAQLKTLTIGSAAQVRIPGSDPISGRIAYIDPLLNEETRTGRVRVEAANLARRLNAGSFAEITFKTVQVAKAKSEAIVVIPEDAIQRIGDRSVIFIPRENQPGHFEVRDIQPGGAFDGMQRVSAGLKAGEQVVTKGSFALKAQLMRAELDEDHK